LRTFLKVASGLKMVVEDGEPEGRGRPSPGWAWLAVGLVIGAGVSVLALRGDDAGTPTTVISPDPTQEEPEGIAEVVEGFPDGLVAAFRSDGQSLQLVVWPLAGEPIVRTIPVGVSRPPGPVDSDLSASRLATLLPVPDEAHGVLYAGVPEQAEIVATEVTGYAWHDTDPSRLAYTTTSGDEMLIWSISNPPADPELITRVVGIVGGLRAWGNWGYAIQDEERASIVLFTDGGEIKATHPGRVLDSDGAGWLAVDDGEITLVSSGGGVARTDGLGEEAVAARFSPTGDEIALLGDDGARVVSLDDGATLVTSPERPGVPELAWSSDGRFVVYPAVQGIAVLDTADQGSDRVLIDRVFTGLGVLPVGDT
jgi:hypothetical protein